MLEKPSRIMESKLCPMPSSSPAQSSPSPNGFWRGQVWRHRGFEPWEMAGDAPTTLRVLSSLGSPSHPPRNNSPAPERSEMAQSEHANEPVHFLQLFHSLLLFISFSISVSCTVPGLLVGTFGADVAREVECKYLWVTRRDFGI